MEFFNKKSDSKCLFIFDVVLPTIEDVGFSHGNDHLFKFLVPPVGESFSESLDTAHWCSWWFIVCFPVARKK